MEKQVVEKKQEMESCIKLTRNERHRDSKTFIDDNDDMNYGIVFGSQSNFLDPFFFSKSFMNCISSAVSSKSNTFMFSFMCAGFEAFGRGMISR